ncbi:uncharacterized protein [Pocillopora verrucosa]|uniref:uncharacterized protein isoform X1 n=1 Tax=Pocillopora verrucosa TaxID=203993 RepID=UPI00333E6104
MRMALIVLEDCEENNFIETIKSPKDDDTTNTRPLYLFLLDPCQLLLNQRGLALLEKGNLMQIFYHQGTMIVKSFNVNQKLAADIMYSTYLQYMGWSNSSCNLNEALLHPCWDCFGCPCNIM